MFRSWKTPLKVKALAKLRGHLGAASQAVWSGFSIKAFENWGGLAFSPLLLYNLITLTTQNQFPSPTKISFHPPHKTMSKFCNPDALFSRYLFDDVVAHCSRLAKECNACYVLRECLRWRTQTALGVRYHI